MTQGNGSAHGAAKKEYTPRLIFWEVTKGCNLRCIHCRATATELMSPDDLPTEKALDIISQIADFGNPILVLSGGEPLYRADIFELAKYGTSRGLRVALATNGTLVTKDVAQKIKDAGIKRVSISLDGSDATTHDTFRGIPGAFDAAIYGMKNLQQIGVSVQINTTIARHNAHQLPAVLELARSLGADALHTFLLVPVGCGVDIAAEQMVPPEEYERMLNWFYDQSLEGGIELKATCAPHYFRVARQRRAADKMAGREQPAGETRPRQRDWPDRHDDAGLDRDLSEARWWTARRPHWTSRRPSRRHERHDQGLPRRNRRLLPLARGRSFSLRISAGAGRRPAQAELRRHLEQL